MRSDSIIIGGKPYPVVGLSVLQSIKEDILAAEANRGDDIDKRAEARIRRMAISLQNGGAFLPDPANPNGEIGASGLKVEAIVAMLGGFTMFSDSAEFYEAERKIMGLTGFLKDTPQKDGTEASGESHATE